MKTELESHMVQFKDLVLQAIPTDFMDQVLQDVSGASGVSNLTIANLLMDAAGLPKMGQDAKDLQEQLKVKVEEAVVRAQKRADDLFAAQGLPSRPRGGLWHRHRVARLEEGPPGDLRVDDRHQYGERLARGDRHGGGHGAEFRERHGAQ